MKPKLTIIGRSFGNTGDPYAFVYYINWILAPFFDLTFLFGTKRQDPFIRYFQELQKQVQLKWIEFDNMGDFPTVIEQLFELAKAQESDALIISQGVIFRAEDVLEARDLCHNQHFLAASIAIETQKNFNASPGLAGYNAFRFFSLEYLKMFRGISPAAKTGFLENIMLRIGDHIESIPVGGNEEVTSDTRIIIEVLKQKGLSLGQPLPQALFAHRISRPLFMGIQTSSDQVGFSAKMARKVHSAQAQIKFEHGPENLFNLLVTYQTAWFLY